MKKTFLFIMCGVLVLTLLTGCGNDKKNKIEIKDWKDIYFYYLKNLEELNPVKIGNVGFVDSKVSDIPIMYVQEEDTNKSEDNKSVSYYYIKDDEVVFLHGLAGNEYSEVKYLYNIEKQEYGYYEISKWNDAYLYILLEKYIQGWAEYENKDDFGVAAYETSDDGFIKSNDNTKKHIDDVLIDTGVEENFFKYTNDKDAFMKELDNYKKQTDFVTDEVKKKVESEINNIKGNPNKSATNTTSIKVGSYTLKYGKYRACFDTSNCREFILNQDGTAIFDGKSKYFRVDNYDFAQGVEPKIYPSIIFSDNKDGNAGINVYTPYISTPDCLMTDGEIECVKYIGK